MGANGRKGRLATRPFRVCRYAGCVRAAARGAAFCLDHSRTAEAKAFRTQVQSAVNRSAGLDVSERIVAPTRTADDPYAAERRRREEAFDRQTKKGEYKDLLDAMVDRVLDQAADEIEVRKEIGAIRFGIRKTIAEEPDNYRLMLSLSRGAGAMAKLMIAHHVTRDPKPVYRYGEKWSPPHAEEGLVKYIWRHRPVDFEQKYMVRVAELDARATDIENRIRTEYNQTQRDPRNRPNAEGRYDPVIPHTLQLEFDMRVRSGEFTDDDWTRFMWENERRQKPLEPDWEAGLVEQGYLSETPDPRFFASDHVVKPLGWTPEPEPEAVAEPDEPLPDPGPPKRFGDNHRDRTAVGNAIDEDEVDDDYAW